MSDKITVKIVTDLKAPGHQHVASDSFQKYMSQPIYQKQNTYLRHNVGDTRGKY